VKKKKAMITVVPAKQAKQNFGAVMRRVYQDDEPQVIERLGMPVVAWVSMKDFERLYPERVEQLSGGKSAIERQAAAKRLREFLASLPPVDATEEEVDRDVMREVYAVRYGERKKK